MSARIQPMLPSLGSWEFQTSVVWVRHSPNWNLAHEFCHSLNVVLEVMPIIRVEAVASSLSNRIGLSGGGPCIRLLTT